MATQCQTALRSGSGEDQNIGVVNSLEGKKGGSQLQNKNLIWVVSYKMCLLSLYFVNYMIFIPRNALYGKIGVTSVHNFALRKFDFRG